MTENYQVLAIKYRPQKFSDVIGQDVLVKTLTNAIEKNKIHHAFILNGIRGVGKTTTARLIAKSLNCTGGDGKETVEPCLECSHCKAIAKGEDPDVIEFDAASHTGVNDIRDIIEKINYAPVSSKYKIYIIDEVHMLSNSAFNALLKTLEEPPEHVKFIFATTEIRKVPITILSRCIRFDLNRINSDVLADYLINIAKKENYDLNGVGATLIANAAEGSVRDSLSLLDRVISFNNFSRDIGEEVVVDVLGMSGREKTYDLYGFLLRGDVENTLKTFNEMYNNIVDMSLFLNDLLDITHKLLMRNNNMEIENLLTSQKKWIDENYSVVKIPELFRIWQFIMKAIVEIKNINNQKNFMEVLFLKICYGASIPEIGDIIKKLQNNSANINLKSSLGEKTLNTFSGAKFV